MTAAGVVSAVARRVRDEMKRARVKSMLASVGEVWSLSE